MGGTIQSADSKALAINKIDALFIPNPATLLHPLNVSLQAGCQ